MRPGLPETEINTDVARPVPDVPFLVLVLVATFCYVLGFHGRGKFWLWLGALAAGWAFLMRYVLAQSRADMPPLGGGSR